MQDLSSPGQTSQQSKARVAPTATGNYAPLCNLYIQFHINTKFPIPEYSLFRSLCTKTQQWMSVWFAVHLILRLWPISTAHSWPVANYYCIGFDRWWSRGGESSAQVLGSDSGMHSQTLQLMEAGTRGVCRFISWYARLQRRPDLKVYGDEESAYKALPPLSVIDNKTRQCFCCKSSEREMGERTRDTSLWTARDLEAVSGWLAEAFLKASGARRSSLGCLCMTAWCRLLHPAAHEARGLLHLPCCSPDGDSAANPWLN